MRAIEPVFGCVTVCTPAPLLVEGAPLLVEKRAAIGRLVRARVSPYTPLLFARIGARQQRRNAPEKAGAPSGARNA